MDPYQENSLALGAQSAREIEVMSLAERLCRLERHFEANFTPEEDRKILREIIERNDEISLSLCRGFLAKSPKKRNVSEVTALTLIEKAATQLHNIDPSISIMALPKSGSGALFLDQGCLVREEDKRSDNDTKSLDFLIETSSVTIVVGAKHTSGRGGAQDHQRKDLVRLIREASGSEGDLEPGLALIALADGDHYTLPRRGKSNHLLEMKEIAKKASPSSRARVVQYPDLAATIRDLLRA